MIDLEDFPRRSLVEVRFNGGPLHGRACLMRDPESEMTMELHDGQCVVYARDRRHLEGIESESMRVVVYTAI